MFNQMFDGDFRTRRPTQNLSGNSRSVDRNELVRKAQAERKQREMLRNQQNSAITVQAFMRSFVTRQKVKRREKAIFDDYVRQKGVIQFEDLEFLLKRLIFFYYSKDVKDGERLILLSQVVLKSTNSVLNLAISQPIWCYRLQKLLGFCMSQIFLRELSPAIPFRILESFTDKRNLEIHISKHHVFHKIFSYLIRQNYFRSVRLLIEEKIPELDEERVTPMNPVAETIMQLLLRPLKLVESAHDELSRLILGSFAYHILSLELLDAIRFFIIPALAEHDDFPFMIMLNYLSHINRQQAELKNTILIDIEEQPTRKDRVPTQPVFSSFLLYAILRLDLRHVAKLHETEHLAHYIEVVAAMMGSLDALPKLSNEWHRNDDSSDSEAEDNDDQDVEMQVHGEREILLEIVRMLNDQRRVMLVIDQIEYCLDKSDLVLCICQICHQLMTYNRLAVYEYKLLYMLASKPQFIRTLYYNLTSQTNQQGFQAPISLLSKGIIIPKHEADHIIPLLATFCALFGRLIATLHDGEFTQENMMPGTTSQIMPFTLQEIVALSTTLKEICLGLVELAFPETRAGLRSHYSTVLMSINENRETTIAAASPSRTDGNKNVYPHLMKVCVSLLRQLHTRDLRCGFCPDGHWAAQNLNLPLDKTTDAQFVIGRRHRPRPFQPIKDFTRDDLENGPPMSTKQIRSITILREIPFVVAFNTRVGIFQGLLAADKLRSQGDLQGFLQGPSINIKVRRSHLYEDAFDKLSKENEPDMRPRFRVQMISAVGLEEVGIDGGGVFREFLSELLKAAFDPHRGFFMISKDNMLYPNPYVGKIYENYQKHYYFIGRILGKALYENLLVELPLAEFFLSKLAGKHADVDIHQMASLDPVLHRSLMSLKAYEGDVSDLGLDFTVVCDELGETRVEELKENGANIMVNLANRLEYITLMADFKLNRQIRSQCASFRQGLANVLPIEWLYMFSNKELQTLISGAEHPIDVDDMKNFTRYGGEYSAENPTIQLFWKVLTDFDDLQRRQLLKFVTSCSRPPLLGFKDLDPPFTIHQTSGETDRLPTASTCMNLLKLPPFTSEELLREKLLYAIQSGSGFELS